MRAIDADYMKRQVDIHGTNKYGMLDENIRVFIDQQPTIEPEPHWIPVTERLPDSDDRYLVTCSKIGAWVVDWNIWHCEPKPGWLWEQGVTAWMPMPEPWEGEEKND